MISIFNLKQRLISLFITISIISTFFTVAHATDIEYKTVYVDDNFIRFEIGGEFTTGTYSFDFVPSMTGDYAFYFDKLQYEESPQITLSVLDGDRKIDLEYKQDIPYINSEDETKNTTADGIYQYRETLSTDYSTGTSHICNVSSKNYYRVADKLSLHAALEKGKTYTLQLDATGDFTLENIDVRCLTLPVTGKDNLVSVLDFTDYKLVQTIGNHVYPFTAYTVWNLGSKSVQYFGDECEIIGDYRSKKLSSAKTTVNPFIGGGMTYNLDVTVPGEYKITAFLRNAGKLAAGEKIEASVYFSANRNGVANEKNKWIKYALENTSDKEGYAYTSVSQTFTLEEGAQSLYIRIDDDSTQVNYFKIDYVPYNEAKVDEGFSRFEFSDTGKKFSAGQEQTLRFTPEKSGKYALYIGPVQYVTELSVNIADEAGNGALDSTTVTTLSSAALQRVEPVTFTPINIELTEGKSYLINIKATGIKDGVSKGTISYVDIRNLTVPVSSNRTIVSMMDYTSVYDNPSDSITPNNTTAWSTTHKWEDLGGFPAGNYMSDRLGIKTEYTTSIRNSKFGYTLNFKKSGKYKVTVYGSNINAISSGDDISLTAKVSIGNKSCGTAYYANSEKAERNFETKELSAMECPYIIDVEAGAAEMVVSPCRGNKLNIHGVKIERVEPGINLSYDKTILTDSANPLTLTAQLQNWNNDSVRLFTAQYDSDRRLIKIENVDDIIGTGEFTIEPDINAMTIESFLWNSAFSPICKQATVVKNDGVALRVGKDREYETIEAAVNAAKSLISESDVTIILDSGEYFVENTIDLGAFTGENQLTIVSENTKNPAIISGGKHISGFEFYENGIYRAKVEDGAVSRQLFVDGVRATRARSEGELENCEMTTLDGKKVLVTSTDLSGITQPKVLELVFHDFCKTPRILADEINYDETLGKWVFKFTDNSANWNAMVYNSAPVTTPKWIENSYSLLDEPGEWYLDTDADYLYYMPRPFEDMDKVSVVMPVTEKLFTAEGTADNPIKNITFKNINFSDTTWLKPSTVRAMKSAQNELNGDLSDTGRLIDGAIEFENAHNIEISECSFNHIGSIAVKMWGAVQNCKIEENEFYDISSSAIAIGEVKDEASNAALRYPPDNKSIKNISVKNNYIRKYGADYHSSAAIGLSFLKDSEISHNEICDGMYSSIHCGWGWADEIPNITKNLKINNNYIHNVMNKDLYDGGAIYLLGNTDGDVAMNYVSGNYIKNVGSYTLNVDNLGGSIYPDNGSCYWTFTNNVIDQSEFDSYIKENGLNKPTVDWLNSWSKDQHHLYAHDNYSTSYDYDDMGTNTNIEQAYVYENADWPEEALGIIDNSGIQKLKNISFDYGIQEVKYKEDYQIENGETVKIDLMALTSKDMLYDLSQAEIYSVSSNEDVVTADGITVTGVGTGNAKVRIFILTNNSQRKELYEVGINITVL